jgi:putative ABC transport system permease protein
MIFRLNEEPNMRTFLQDLRYGVRMLLKQPGFTIIAVLTLALGVGANSAIFSVVNGALLKPLPYPESERLVWLAERALNFPTMSISYPNFTDWRAQQTTFEQFGVYNSTSMNLTGRGEPLRLNGTRISADALTAVRAQAAIGRIFNNDEDKPGAPLVVVLSYALWQSRFGSDPKILNQTITLDGRAYTVIGVAPPDFAFPYRVDLWTPVGPKSSEPSWQSRGNHPGLKGVARLKPGVTLEQARADMDAIAVRLGQQYPDTNKHNRVRVEYLLDEYVSDSRWALWTLLGAVGLVLLIACANVANLLLARAASRQKEMAVRAAMGASRFRILRQLLTESLLLAVLGGGLGLLVAQWGVPMILTMGGDVIPRASEIRLDPMVLAFTAVTALLTGVLFGLAPAWQASRPDVQTVLKETARTTTGGRTWLRRGLVIGEVALTLTLLIGAGLLLRSFHRLQQVDPGFSPDHILSFRLNLPVRKYETSEQQIAFVQSLEQKLRALPGVSDVGFASQIPLDDNDWQTGFLIEGRPAPPPNERPSMEVTLVSPEYFRVMQAPLLQGRYFTEQDNRAHLAGRDFKGQSGEQRWIAGAKSAIIDEEFARRYWPNESPIGKQIRLPWSDRPEQQPVLTVIGVVARVKTDRLNEQGGFVQVYFPIFQAPTDNLTAVVKTTIEPETLGAAARAQVTAVDPDQPIYEMRTLTAMRDNSMASERLNLQLLGAFAVVGLLLAAIGLYGVLSNSVTERNHEIGVRLALGAQNRDVLRLVLRQGMSLAMVGVGVGLAASLALTRLMKSLLFGVGAADPLTYSTIVLLMALVAFLACYLPARRATRVDPMVALRAD